MGIPTKDTAAGVSADSSQILIRPADSSLYVKYKRTWIRVGGGGGSIGGSGTINYVPKFTASGFIGNSQIFDNGTNVGIGTASPVRTLTLSGSSAVYQNIQGGASSDVGLLLGPIGNDAVGRIVYSNANNNLQLWTNATQQVTILNTGNVGIGTASPAAKLSVNGTTLINTNTDNGVDKLQVNGSASISTDASIKRYLDVGTAGTSVNAYLRTLDGSVITKVQSVGGSNVGYVGTESNHDFNFITNNSIRATISAAGAATFNSSLNVSTLATTNNLSVTTNATVGGTLNVTGSASIQGTLSGSTFSPSQLNSGSLNNSSLITTKSISLAYTNISTTYTTTANDYFINITSGTFTLNFISAVTYPGLVCVIKNSGTGTITLDPSGTQTIDGSTTVTMNVQNQTYTLISDGSNWKIVSKYL